MKSTLAAVLFLLSLGAMANHHEDMDQKHKEWEKKFDSMSFEDAKKMKLEMMDKKSAMMEENRKCINDAKDKPALKACMKEGHEKMKEMKHEMKDKMKKK